MVGCSSIIDISLMFRIENSLPLHGDRIMDGRPVVRARCFRSVRNQFQARHSRVSEEWSLESQVFYFRG